MATVRKALARERAAIAAHPKDPANYVDLAYTLNDAGMGEQARSAAAEATQVAPASGFAFSAQGWVLHHNSIGVDYGNGFDYDGALRAYRKAIELDPKDLDVRQSLANLLEFNREGVRYAPDAQLSNAIEVYRYVERHQRPLQLDTVDNLAIDLFYAGRYEEAIGELSDGQGTTQHLGIILASVAASKGSRASIALSNQIEGDEQRRKDALNFAAEGLWNKRLYPQAADLLTASLPDMARGAAVSAKIQLFRNLQPYTAVDLPASDPRRPVQRLMEMAFMGTLGESSAKELFSRRSFATEAAWGSASQQSAGIAGNLLALMKQTGLPRSVVTDIVLSKMSITASPGSSAWASVRLQGLGFAPLVFFVVSEDGTWRIAGSGGTPREIGAQALYLLAHGEAETAGACLDWYYASLNPSGAAGDPLSGNYFARLWAPHARGASDAALLAAASLTDDAALLRPLVPVMMKAREEASAGERRDDLDLLLTTVYVRLGDAPKARAVSARLLEEYPDSNEALHLAGRAFALDHDFVAWKAVLAKRLQAEPQNRDVLLESAAEASAEGDTARARAAYGTILDGSHGTSADETMYAWLSLFDGMPDDRALAAAQQATISASSRSYQGLLALACVDAARGNTAQAHQELLDAMSSGHLAQPDAGIWYGFGRIFEQYGVVDAAVAAYQRTVQMAEAADAQGPASTGVRVSTLARMRLREPATK